MKQSDIQNGVIINGVVYEWVKWDGTGTCACASCSLFEKCRDDWEVVPCIGLFGISRGYNFKKVNPSV